MTKTMMVTPTAAAKPPKKDATSNFLPVSGGVVDLGFGVEDGGEVGLPLVVCEVVSLVLMVVLFPSGAVVTLLNGVVGSDVSLLKGVEGSVVALLNGVDGSVVALLNGVDGSVVALLTRVVGSVVPLLVSGVVTFAVV